MSGSRPSLFDDGDNLNLDQFVPRSEPLPAVAPPDTVRQVSEEGGFPSRAPAHRPAAAPTPIPAAMPSRRKSGRTVLLNARITQRAHDRFHQLVAAEHERFEAGDITHKVTLGEMVERALAALERELGGQGRGHD